MREPFREGVAWRRPSTLRPWQLTHIGYTQRYNKACDEYTNTVPKLMTFLLAFERTHRVLKAKAEGVIATQDLLDLDIALIAFLAREETAGRPSIRGLYDFSEVAAIAVPQTKAAERGSLSAILRGRRVMVQSQTLACSLVETFVESQRLAGDYHLVVVNSLDEANALLGLNAPNFEAIG
jgi:hypothetical protein